MINEIQHEDRKNHPWVGLVPYEESDAPLFYGRSREADELTHTIIEGPQTTIYGPSGVGKTSLLRAGVFPRLEERHFLPVYIRLDHSKGASDCATQTLNALKKEFSHCGVDIDPLAERVAPELPETLWEFLHRHEFWNVRNHLLKPVLVFDQFEEMFTLAGTSRAEQFITELGDLCGNSPPRALDEFLATSGRRLGYSVETQNYRVVLCLREDFLARLEELTKPIPSLRRNRFSLQAMSPDQALEAVLGPGKEFVDETVARRIVEVVTVARESREGAAILPAGAPNVEPALLSLFCRELNNRRLARNQVCITIDLVEESRRDILRDFYQRALDSVSAETAAFIEEHLLTTSGYRNAVAVDDLRAADIPLAEIEELANGRLLRFEERKGLRWVEFSHDILTAVARESRDARRNEEALRKERERTEALEKETARERHRVRLAVGVIAVLLVLVASLGGGFFYLFFMEHVTYYHGVVKRYGFMEGVGELSLDKVRHRQCSYKFIQHGLLTPTLDPKPVERVVAVNGHDLPTTEHGLETYLWSPYEESQSNQGGGAGVASVEMQEKLASVCQWEFVRGEDGRIVYEKGYDKDGKMVWGLVYSPSPDPYKYVCGRFVGPQGFPQKQRSAGAEYVQITHNEHGFEKLHEYRDASGAPALGRGGAYGMRFEYDARGLCTSQASIDANGEYMTNSDGIIMERLTYDSQGRLVKGIAFCPGGFRCVNRDGIAEAHVSYDDYGNMIEARFYGVDGSPCLHKDVNHGWTKQYDERGNVVEATNLGLDGRPILLANGYATVRRAYDGRGNMINEAYFDPEGKPAIDTSSGIHKALRRYDGRGNEIEQRYYAIDGSPCLHKDGNHAWTRQYDERGNEIEVTFLGLDGRPTVLANGYATVRRLYDGRGNEVEWACFDAEGKPAIDKTDGTHKRVRRYDGRGNEIEQRYYAIDGTTCLHKDGNHGWTRQYDERGNEIEVTFLGLDGRASVLATGYATVRRAYDGRGNEVEWACFDAEGKPAIDTSSGTHKVLHRYDGRGNEIEQRYYAIDGSPCLHKDGNHGWTRQYDERGNVVEESYFDIDGVPILMLPVIVAVEIIPGSNAAKAGVLPGDVFLEYADWQWVAHLEKDSKGVFQALLETIEARKPAAKRLVVWRKGRILTFGFPPGLMGIRINKRVILAEQTQEMRKSYKTWREQDVQP